MLIPLFMIKEGERFEKKAIADGYDITPLEEEKKVGIVESIKLTFSLLNSSSHISRILFCRSGKQIPYNIYPRQKRRHPCR